MRTARLKGKPGLDRVFFHCISRVVDKRFVFGDAEKEEFVRMMRRYETFCGVRIVTYCVMGNHFHLLVEVPKRPESADEMPSDDELWERAEALYGENGCATLRQRWDWLLDQKARGQYVDDALDAIRESFTARMWDISQFMKGLKQRFTQWYNRTHNRVGTLWESRFKSLLVEGTGESLSTMAAYIDLNPVRAGMVTDPAEYRWCGYGEAMAGGLRAQEGIHIVAQANNLSGGKPFSLEDALGRYRAYVWTEGREVEDKDPDGNRIVVRRGFSREEVRSVLAQGGKLNRDELLRCRVRYFSDGGAFGSREFVDGVFEANREMLGVKRTSGARRMQHVEDAGFYTIRELKKDVIH